MTMFSTQYVKIYEEFYGINRVKSEVEEIYNLTIDSFCSKGKVLDIGCGTGLHLSEFANRWENLAGCDPSDAMLNIARHRPNLSNCKLVKCGVSEIHDYFREIDLAIMNFNVFGYLIQDAEVTKAFRALKGSLTKGGLLIFDFWGRSKQKDTRSVSEMEFNFEGELWKRRAEKIRVHCDLININFEFINLSDTAQTFSEHHVVREFELATVENFLADFKFAVQSIQKLGSKSYPGYRILAKNEN
jgi:SAM-dependent methyltransferase